MKSPSGTKRSALPIGKVPRGSDRMAVVEWDVEDIRLILEQLNAMLLDVEARVHQLDNKRYAGKVPHTEDQHGSTTR